jgi:hypothetical protein
MGHMKKGETFRTIQIPEWMDAAITDLAAKHNRDTESEIAFLIKAALEHLPKPGSGDDPASVLQEELITKKRGQ